MFAAVGRLTGGVALPPARPLAGVRGAILAGACIVGGVNAMIAGAPPLIPAVLFLLAAILGVWGQ